MFTNFQWGTFHLDEESAYRTNGVPKFPENGVNGNFVTNLPKSLLRRKLD